MEDTEETQTEKRVITPEIRAQIEQIADETLDKRRPTGSYRQDGIIPLGADIWKKMSMATREDLLAWEAIEHDPANLKYIASRLAAWDSAKHQTLADLEQGYER